MKLDISPSRMNTDRGCLRKGVEKNNLCGLKRSINHPRLFDVRLEESSTARERGKSLFGLCGWHQPDKMASNFIVLVLISERNI